MDEKPKGRRVENFSDADVIAHGREARRKRRPIWTNPFLKERAALWPGICLSQREQRQRVKF